MPSSTVIARWAKSARIVLRALRCSCKTLLVERLQQVVDCFSVERLKSIFVICSGENYLGPGIRPDGIDDTEAVVIGHLNIKEHQGNTQLMESADRICGCGTLPNHTEVRIAPKKNAKLLAS